MSEPMSVLIADDMSKKAVEILKEAGFTVDVKVGMKPEELAAVVGNYHGLGIRSASKVTAATLANPGKLKIIGRAGVGVDNIDTAAAAAKDILVINTPQGNAPAAAELAIGLLFAQARKSPQAAGRGVGLKMNGIGYDRMLPANAQVPAGVQVVAFDDLLAKSDFITLHVPMTKETNDLFNTATFAKMKEGACIINCARGGIVNETEVLEALNSGQLAGAALDVITKEPPDASPLFAHDNLFAVPHLGASTKEAQEKAAIELAEEFDAFQKNGVVRNAVNRKYPRFPCWEHPRCGCPRGCATSRPARRPPAVASPKRWSACSNAGDTRASSPPRSSTRTCWGWGWGPRRAPSPCASSSPARAASWRCGPTSRPRSRGSSPRGIATRRGRSGFVTKGR